MPLKEPPFVRVFSLRPVCLTLECDFHFKALWLACLCLLQPSTRTRRRWRIWCRGSRTVSVFPARRQTCLTTSMSSTVHPQAAGGSPVTPEVGNYFVFWWFIPCRLLLLGGGFSRVYFICFSSSFTDNSSQYVSCRSALLPGALLVLRVPGMQSAWASDAKPLNPSKSFTSPRTGKTIMNLNLPCESGELVRIQTNVPKHKSHNTGNKTDGGDASDGVCQYSLVALKTTTGYIRLDSPPTFSAIVSLF